MMSISLLIADDHEIIREGLRGLVKAHPDLELLAEASDGRQAVDLALSLKPKVVVMDINMPSLNGVDATRQIMQANPSVGVIALSAHTDSKFVRSIFQAGARGYLLKESAFKELVLAIHTVHQGGIYLSPRLTNLVMRDYMQDVLSEDAGKPVLSPREREVLQLVAEGKNTKEIAYMLGVSVKTIETHRQNIMAKLNMFSVAELTKYALREGLTSLD
jgi:DNA-binding NarL/FixJ family response regulator